MTEVLIIRHGETEWNVEGRYQGQADPPLNDRGIQQAYELAEALYDHTLEVIYSSPLKRAYQTAEILAKKLNIEVRIEPRLAEIHQGDWQTHLRTEIQSLYPDLFHQWETDPWHTTPPGGEHLSQVQSRVNTALDDISCRHPLGSVGLVTHRIPIALIKMRIQNLPPDIVRSIQLPNTYFESLTISCPEAKH
jgi:broad specificity phosphatase PhoE